MTSQRSSLPVGGLAFAGGVAAHALTYAAVAGTGADELLRETGHGYLGVAAAGSAALGIIATASIFARRAFGRAAHGPIRPAHFAAKLAALQALLFAVVEIVERIAQGLPPASVLGQGILWTGFVFQALVAVALTASIVFLTRGVERAARVLAHVAVCPPRTPVLLAVPVCGSPAHAQFLNHIFVRGPPGA